MCVKAEIILYNNKGNLAVKKIQVIGKYEILLIVSSRKSEKNRYCVMLLIIIKYLNKK